MTQCICPRIAAGSTRQRFVFVSTQYYDLLSSIFFYLLPSETYLIIGRLTELLASRNMQAHIMYDRRILMFFLSKLRDG
jgi:hypothetical protein